MAASNPTKYRTTVDGFLFYSALDEKIALCESERKRGKEMAVSMTERDWALEQLVTNFDVPDGISVEEVKNLFIPTEDDTKENNERYIAYHNIGELVKELLEKNHIEVYTEENPPSVQALLPLFHGSDAVKYHSRR